MTFTPPRFCPAKYVTEEGREAIVHFRMPNGDFVGHVGNRVYRWSDDGRHRNYSPWSLRDKPKRIVRWQNQYPDGTSSVWLKSRKEADELAIDGRTCVWRAESDEDFRNPNITAEDV